MSLVIDAIFALKHFENCQENSDENYFGPFQTAVMCCHTQAKWRPQLSGGTKSEIETIKIVLQSIDFKSK